jgi:hypothetical protein
MLHYFIVIFFNKKIEKVFECDFEQIKIDNLKKQNPKLIM